ncbi:MAG: CsbD family protein [Chloroflexi bacterium]|nr:MAG: CsbD family protein [Chloroflexota bacterium]
MGELRDKVEGEVKESGGKLSGDKKMEWEGKAQKAKGKVEEVGREMTQGDPTTEEPVPDKGL